MMERKKRKEERDNRERLDPDARGKIGVWHRVK